jgi:hypothetical protein
LEERKKTPCFVLRYNIEGENVFIINIHPIQFVIHIIPSLFSEDTENLLRYFVNMFQRRLELKQLNISDSIWAGWIREIDRLSKELRKIN